MKNLSHSRYLQKIYWTQLCLLEAYPEPKSLSSADLDALYELYGTNKQVAARLAPQLITLAIKEHKRKNLKCSYIIATMNYEWASG